MDKPRIDTWGDRPSAYRQKTYELRLRQIKREKALYPSICQECGRTIHPQELQIAVSQSFFELK